MSREDTRAKVLVGHTPRLPMGNLVPEAGVLITTPSLSIQAKKN